MSSINKNTSTSDYEIKMDKLEKEGMNKVMELQKKEGRIISSEQGITQLLQNCEKDFESAMGRKMTYSEMRELYG